MATLLVVELITGATLLVLPGRDAPVGARRTAEPVAAAPLVVGSDRGVELVNLGGATAGALLHRIAADIDSAVAAVEAFWGTDWPHRIVVVATGSDWQFAAQAGDAAGADSGQWSDVAAVAVADRVDPDRRLAAGQRIVFAPGASRMSPAALRIVLTHELFHYAARADTAFDAPHWLTEGVADFVARGAATPVDRTGAAVFPPALPTDADLAALEPDRSRAYDRAWWFTSFIAEAYGTAKLRELYRAACGPGHANVPSAVHRTLGVTVPDLLSRWQRWLASQS